jgi:predicted acetyltransferase
MSIEVIRASKADRSVIRNLTELYLHDFSELEDMDVNEHGLFDYYELDLFWADVRRHPFLARCDGKIAGFALVQQGFLDERTGAEDDALVDMIDFFVLRKYRRRGVGRAMATTCFTAVPGRWQVRADTYNPVAISFWRSTIDGFTGGAYETLSEGTGVTFYFASEQAS